MSEGRQLALLLVGGLVLAVLGVVAATAFPEPCEEIEGIGTLELSFVGAADALDLTTGDVASLEGVGERLGLGPWRGAVVLPPDATVLPSEFGFFAVTTTDLVALRPSVGLASAARDVAGSTVVPVAGRSAGVVTPDRTMAVVASDYERERCGALPPDGEVLAVDRGFALLRTGPREVELWTLSGERLWARSYEADVVGGVVVEERALVATGAGVAASALRDGGPAGEVAVDVVEVLSAVHGRLVLAGMIERAGPTTVLDVGVDGDGGLVVDRLAAPGRLVDASPTPAGLVAATGTSLLTDRGGTEPLPAGIEPGEVVTSADGQVGVLVGGPDRRVLLVWGRDVD